MTYFNKCKRNKNNTHTHTHIYIYIYIYVCVCVCVCTADLCVFYGVYFDLIFATMWYIYIYTATGKILPNLILCSFCCNKIIVCHSNHHHHHHDVQLAQISLTLSLHVFLSFIAFGRSSGLHPVSSHSCCMNVRAGRPAFDWPYAGVHRSISLTISSLLLQQCPACLVIRIEN